MKKQVKKYITWAIIAPLVAVLAFMPLLTAREDTDEGPQASILSCTAQSAEISSQIIGGGTLTSQDAVEITIPAAVKLTGYLVSNGDTVTEGQPIASVDRVTVMTAITQVQETLDYLTEEIEAIQDEETPDTVTAQAGGTVKIVCAAEGEAVRDVMLRDGALAVLSLDGLMAVQVTRNTDLASGDSVCVTLPDDTEVEGRVESNLDGILTVTIEDKGYAPGETVKVTSEDGGRIGSGVLYIHSQWNAVAYTGSISDIAIREGDSVVAGSTLFRLEDTGHTAEFHALSAQHREYEAWMLTLFQLYQTETITAPCSGVVSGVDEAGAYMLANSCSGWQLTLLVNSPNGDDETGYINFVGQVLSVGIDGLVMKVNPQWLAITDYKDLSGVPLDPALMTQDLIYTANAPVYELANGEWVQIAAADIQAGDTLLFAGDEDGNFIWVVRVAKAQAEPETPDATEPAEPEEPETPTEPAIPEDSTQPGGNFPQGGVSMPGFSGGMVQQEEFQLYALDTLTIASVTPQEAMTLTISIDELDITIIFPGQSADITLDALPGEKFAATVTRIGNLGESDGGSSKFTVELTLEKSGNMLPGMSASAFITLDAVSSAVSVPVAALTEIGTETILHTSYDEETGNLGDPVVVTVGVSDGENAEILSGIVEGTIIYYSYYDTLVISDTPEDRRFPFGR